MNDHELEVINSINVLLESLCPLDKIPTLNRDEAYHLCNLTSEIIGHVQAYSNTVWGHFHHLNKPIEDPGEQVLLRKLERALTNRGIDLNNLLDSLNEGSK